MKPVEIPEGTVPLLLASTEHIRGEDHLVDWTPLEDNWDKLARMIEEAAIEGLLQDPELADKHAWPLELSLADDEKEQVGQFTVDRVSELFEVFENERVISPRLIGQYILHSVLTGMTWQRERIGN